MKHERATEGENIILERERGREGRWRMKEFKKEQREDRENVEREREREPKPHLPVFFFRGMGGAFSSPPVSACPFIRSSLYLLTARMADTTSLLVGCG